MLSKYGNMRYAGLRQVTFTDAHKCQHKNGWYVTVHFWIFKKNVFVCSDCGEVLPDMKG